MESRVAEVRASAKDDLEEETRSEIMSMRKQHIEEMGEMRKRDGQYFEVSLSFFLSFFLYHLVPVSHFSYSLSAVVAFSLFPKLVNNVDIFSIISRLRLQSRHRTLQHHLQYYLPLT